MISIKEYGFNVPLVVNKDMVLITGHARLKAAKKLGLQTVPCVIVNLSERKAKKYRIADNKIQELTDWKEDELFKELREIGDQVELMDIGFSMTEIDKIVGSFDVDETPVPVYAGGDDEEEEFEVVAVAAAPVQSGMSEEDKAKLEEQLRKREAELAGRFVKESYEQHAKDNLIACPHCGKSFKVRGLT